MASDTAVKVRKIAPGVSGGPKDLDYTDPRAATQFNAEMRGSGKYDSPSTVDQPAGPRGYARGGKATATKNFCKGGKVISSKNY